MASLKSILKGPGQGDLIKINNMTAQVAAPPLMRQAEAVNYTDGSDLVLLPVLEGKAYIIYGYWLIVQNDAGTPAANVVINYTDFNTGATMNLTRLLITPNAVETQRSEMSGLNVITAPNTAVTAHAGGNAVSKVKSAAVFYSVVDV